MIVQFRPWPFVEPEVFEADFAGGRLVGPKLLCKCEIAAPHLLQEDVVYQTGGRDQVGQGGPILRGKLRNIHWHLHRGEAGAHGCELRNRDFSGGNSRAHKGDHQRGRNICSHK